MMLGMYSAISQCQMCLSACSIGDCGPEQRGKIWVIILIWVNIHSMWMNNIFPFEWIILPVCFPAKSTPSIVWSLVHAVGILTMSSCCKELMENTSIQSLWFLDALRIWNSGGNKSQCLLSLTDLSMIILGKHYLTREMWVWSPVSFLPETLFKRFIIKLLPLPFF